MVDVSSERFERPGRIDDFFNRVIRALLRLGLAPSHIRLLEVRGRKSGNVYSLPVDLLVKGERLFLVAPRGRTQWVRNAEAHGEVILRRGKHRDQYRLSAVPESEKPAILKAYLDGFHREVQRFFPIRAGSPVEEFLSLADRYPAFELQRLTRV